MTSEIVDALFVEGWEPPAYTHPILLLRILQSEESGEERQVLRFVEWSSLVKPKEIGKRQWLDAWLWMTERPRNRGNPV